MKTHAIRIQEYGGPEVLRYEEIELADPAPGEVRVRHTAIGLNFIDTYHRSGLYPLELPTGIGTEAAGVVTAIGAGVTGLAEGDPRAGPVANYGRRQAVQACLAGQGR